jgi:hypothetical protein
MQQDNEIITLHYLQFLWNKSGKNNREEYPPASYNAV